MTRLETAVRAGCGGGCRYPNCPRSMRNLPAHCVILAQAVPRIIDALDALPPTEAEVEAAARKLEPKLWKMIDDNKGDDDWGGATALNARDHSMRLTRAALQAVRAARKGEKL